MTRHKGMSKKMALTAADLNELAGLHDRLRRLQVDMHPLADMTPALLAAAATLTAARGDLAGDGDWLQTSGVNKGSIGGDGLAELEAIWSAMARLSATLAARSPAKHPLYVATLTLKAALAECSGDARAWGFGTMDLSMALARRRSQPPQPVGYMFQGFGRRRTEPPTPQPAISVKGSGHD